MIDILELLDEKGGNIAAVRESQRKRFANVELVDQVFTGYQAWVKTAYEVQSKRTRLNALQKEIGLKKKAKEEPTELLEQKKQIEAGLPAADSEVAEERLAWERKLSVIGNFVHASVPISSTEDDNRVVKTFHPDGPNAGPPKKRDDIHSHHEVMYRLEILDQERGTKVAGHRGYFLVNEGVDLNFALIQYGLDFLRKAGYKKVQPPFMMLRHQMARTAQLEEFDENLYKLEGEGVPADALPQSKTAVTSADKYLIATSEQPISSYFADEWFDDPTSQLPVRFAGYSTCFRKEAGAHGRETWGLFRVHQFEKVEQFCITDPKSSWAEFDRMLAHSEEFYQSLGLPYQVVEIVSGALNNAAAKKCDLEAWFPFQGEYKELVSVSNCTDYQSRSLEVRCGVKKQGDTSKKYVHMLNGTLCATERALCCIVENYQTPEGLRVPDVLQRYLGGREFIPYVRDLPAKKAAKK